MTADYAGSSGTYRRTVPLPDAWIKPIRAEGQGREARKNLLMTVRNREIFPFVFSLITYLFFYMADACSNI